MTEQALAKTSAHDLLLNKNTQQFVTIYVAGQLFGIPVALVHDILAAQEITPIPLAPSDVSGSLNLRGRIVTAIDVRTRLGMPARNQDASFMCIVVEYKGDSYSLVVDNVGEVLDLTIDAFEKNPATLDPKWKKYSDGIYRLENELVIVLDINRFLNITN